MEVAQTEVNRRVGGGLALALALVVSAVGCVETKSFLSPGGDCAPKGAVCQVAASWHNDVEMSPDPTHGGSPVPVLAGRLYLFGPQIGFPLDGDGQVVVEAYQETPGVAPVPLERWQIGPDVLKQLQRKDIVGWGYTLLLPWSSYRPEITQLRMKVEYTPAGKTPLYSESPVTLHAVQSYEVGSSKSPAPQVNGAAAAAGQQAAPLAATQPPAAQQPAAQQPAVQQASAVQQPAAPQALIQQALQQQFAAKLAAAQAAAQAAAPAAPTVQPAVMTPPPPVQAAAPPQEPEPLRILTPPSLRR